MKLQLKHQQLCKQQFLFWLLKQNEQILSCVHVRTTNSPEEIQEIQTQKSKRKLDQDIHLLARTVKMNNLFSPCSCIEFFDILTHYILPSLSWQSTALKPRQRMFESSRENIIRLISISVGAWEQTDYFCLLSRKGGFDSLMSHKFGLVVQMVCTSH